MNKTQHNLSVALDLIKTDGWAQSELWNDSVGGYCLLGAVYAARTGKRREDVVGNEGYEDSPEVEAIVSALKETEWGTNRLNQAKLAKLQEYGDFYTQVYRFNDASCRLLEEVEAVLLKAIEKAGNL
jgi:hypothetical protein